MGSRERSSRNALPCSTSNGRRMAPKRNRETSERWAEQVARRLGRKERARSNEGNGSFAESNRTANRRFLTATDLRPRESKLHDASDEPYHEANRQADHGAENDHVPSGRIVIRQKEENQREANPFAE